MRKKMRMPAQLSGKLSGELRWISMTVAAGLFFAIVPSALAHPGHGVDSSGVGLLHFLPEISHGGSGAILVVATTFAMACIGIANARSRARE